MILRRLAILSFALLIAACASTPGHGPVRRPLIMISMDGFRADYLGRGVTPTLSALAAGGVHAEGMRPSFPALTYPNHYTLVTGLRPDHHGLAHNNMEDARRPGVPFSLGDRTQVMDRFWWDEAEPIWVTAQKAGLKTVNVFWPGSEAPIHGVSPDRWKVFDQKMPADARVDLLLDWIKADHPAFSALYFDDVDTAGHTYGPPAPEVNTALTRVDTAVARLLAGLKAQGLEGKVDIIIVADHGMTLTPNAIYLDQIAEGTARIIATGSTAMLEPVPGREAEADAKLVGRHEHMSCWRKEHIPPRFHYGTNARVGSIVCLGDQGWYLTRTGSTVSKGNHGADPGLDDMSALFIAYGPAFKQGASIDAMDNVDVYQVAMKLLGLTPLPNDGDPNFPAKALRN
jgi:predicted AlkP superfamily pyrophosphatase or phosphodiesterase